ncbi:MAG: Zn-ribbon domain-containing OB-fold protein [Planctomycetota bacterium]|nr:Zn-ribbon domain-containing OB-fold protein [Planctomycetota bacterium]
METREMERNISRLASNRDNRYEEGILGIWNRYTVGIAGERFLRHIKDEGKIYGSRCPKCKALYLPARMFCEMCFTEIPDENWEEVGLSGKLYSFSVVYRDINEKLLDKPVVVGIVEFGSPTARLVHFLGEVEPNKLKIGAKFEAVLKDRSERKGSILDIKYFRPVAR